MREMHVYLAEPRHNLQRVPLLLCARAKHTNKFTFFFFFNSFSGFVRVGGYAGLLDQFVGPAAWPNFTREYENMTRLGLNTTEYQDRYAPCGMCSTSFI